MIDKPRVRLIAGRQFLEVQESIEQQGKYREDKAHWERHDGRYWALASDLERLQKGSKS